MKYLRQILSHATSGYPLVFVFTDDHLEFQDQLIREVDPNGNEKLCIRISEITVATGHRVLSSTANFRVEAGDAHNSDGDRRTQAGDFKDTLRILTGLKHTYPVARTRSLVVDMTILQDHATVIDTPGFTSTIQDVYRKYQMSNAPKEDISDKAIQVLVVVLPTEHVLSNALSNISMSVQHMPPSRKDIIALLMSAVDSRKVKASSEFLEALADNLVGLTASNIKMFLASSMVKAKENTEIQKLISVRDAWGFRAEILNREGLIKVVDTSASRGFEDIGGLDGLKRYTYSCLHNATGETKPRGVLLVSPPGMGKTKYVEALGAETSNPVVMVSFASLMGHLVGQTEAATSRTLATLEAMAPDSSSKSHLIVMLDELDRDLVQTGIDTSGVSTRQLSLVIKWLSSHKSNIYVIGTTNDLTKMDPALTRAGRFDNIFLIENYSKQQRAVVWDICIQREKVKPKKAFWYVAINEQDGLIIEAKETSETADMQDVTKFMTYAEAKKAAAYVSDTYPEAFASIYIPAETPDWSGAEIENCCKHSVLLKVELDEAAEYVVPNQTTYNSGKDSLLVRMSGKCLSASTGKVFKVKNGNSRNSK